MIPQIGRIKRFHIYSNQLLLLKTMACSKKRCLSTEVYTVMITGKLLTKKKLAENRGYCEVTLLITSKDANRVVPNT